MQFTSKEELADMLRFVERQTVFTIETTAKIETYHDFLASQEAMVLFNSTCMCLQTIGETIRRVDERTSGRLFACYLSDLRRVLSDIDAGLRDEELK